MDILTRVAKAIVCRRNTKAEDAGPTSLKTLRELTSKLNDHDMETRKIELMYHTMVQYKDDVVMITRPDTLIAYMSANCEDLLGYTWEEMVGSALWIVHPDDSDRIKMRLLDAQSGGSGKDEIYKIITKSGDVKLISHSWAPLYLNKQLYLISSVLREVPLV